MNKSDEEMLEILEPYVNYLNDKQKIYQDWYEENIFT